MNNELLMSGEPSIRIDIEGKVMLCIKDRELLERIEAKLDALCSSLIQKAVIND